MSIKLEQGKIFGIDLESFKMDKKIEREIEGENKDEVLVFGSDDGVYVFDGRKVERIAERNKVLALAVWNGELYDAGYRKIYRTRDSKVVVNFGKPIYSMIACNKDVLMLT